MINLSSKCRYGVRLMLNLASHYRQGLGAVILKDISKEEKISLRYLEQIIIPLRVSKLVKSVRGAKGGYMLAKDPLKITLNEIIENLDGRICFVDCIDDEDYCDRIPICATHEIWKNASFLLRDYFKKTNLQDLIKIAEKKISQRKKH